MERQHQERGGNGNHRWSQEAPISNNLLLLPSGFQQQNPPGSFPQRTTSTPPPVVGHHDLLEVIRQQQTEINLLKLLVQGNGGGYGQHEGQLAMYRQRASPQPLPLLPRVEPSQASLGEGRYVLHLRAAEGLASLVHHIPPRQAAALSDGRPLVIHLRHFVTTASPLGDPTLLLNERSNRTFANAPVSLNFGKRDGCAVLRHTRYEFSVLGGGELPVFSIEFQIDGKTMAWTDITGDALGERIRPLRLAPVDMARALVEPRAKVVGNAMVVVEFAVEKWREDSSDDDDDLMAPGGLRPLFNARPSVSPQPQLRSNGSTPLGNPQQSKQASPAMPQPEQPSAQVRSGDFTAFPLTPANGTTEFNKGTLPRKKTVAGGGKGNQAPAAVQPSVKLGHGPRGDACRLNLDKVTGVPSSALSTRLVVYLCGTCDDRGFPVRSLGDNLFFVKQPELVAFQEADSLTTSPSFHGELNLVITKDSSALVVVECVEGRGRYTLGHALIPLNTEFFSGSYSTRIRHGDPRPTHLRSTDSKTEATAEKRRSEVLAQVKGSIVSVKETDELAEVLCELLSGPPPASVEEYVPACYLIWRGDCSDRSRPPLEPPGQPPMSENELVLERGRSSLASLTPFQRGLASSDSIVDLFTSAKLTELYDSSAHISRYDPDRGFFVRLHGLRGLTNEKAYYKMTVEPPMPANISISRSVNLDSDVSAPEFTDPPFQFRGVQHDPFAIVIFNLYKFTDPDVRIQAAIRQIGWSVSKIFLDESGVLRHGIFEVPIFQGLPPVQFLNAVKKDPLTSVVTELLGTKSIDYLTPRAILTFSIGDPLRAEELSDSCVSRADPRVLLIVGPKQREFPVHSNIGSNSSSAFPLADITCRSLCGRSNPDEFQSAMHKQFLRFVESL